MTIQPLTAGLEAEIIGVDLRHPVDCPTFAVVEAALHEHGMLCFRDQYLTPAATLPVDDYWLPQRRMIHHMTSKGCALQAAMDTVV